MPIGIPVQDRLDVASQLARKIHEEVLSPAELHDSLEWLIFHLDESKKAMATQDKVMTPFALRNVS